MSINGPLKQVKKYTDGRTKQCFSDECDIEKIMGRANRAGTISHLLKYQGVYADFSDVDFQSMTQKLTQGREIFDDLPAELRKEFEGSPAKFFAYVNDPANADNLRTKLIGATVAGRDINPAVRPTADQEDALASASSPVASEPPQPTPAVAPATPGPAGDSA